MAPRPETDLARLVGGMRPRLHDEALVFVTVRKDVASDVRVVVRIEEDEGTTLVVADDDADRIAGARRTFRCARITLEIHSALEAVGFLAAVTHALADAGIPANPVSGFHHDHVFVPYEERHRALAVLEALARG